MRNTHSNNSLRPGHLNPARHLSLNIAATTMLVIGSAMSVAQAGELPTGGQVAAGQVHIGTSGNTMNINQGSQRAIVNWTGFSVGKNNTVNIHQPNSNAAILNRVNGSMTSRIAGQINANGQVFLINPNGIAITKTGSVKVGGGFTASTLGMKNQDFMKGNLKFNGNGHSSNITNNGHITVNRGGYAALIAGKVTNNGSIIVPMGKIGVGSGEQATLDIAGDGFLQVAIPTKGKQSLINNTGTLSADGGYIQITAATAKQAARQVVNLKGDIQANSVNGKNGSISLTAGKNGQLNLAGNVSATSTTGKGGSIQATGDDIKLANAHLNASGATGGGTIQIGGEKHGKGTLQTASTTTVDKHSTIKADATQAGDGGNVVVWSDKHTDYAGHISAQGKGKAGKGGDAEVSGKQTLNYNGFTNLKGEVSFGTLLLDPKDFTIATSGGDMTGAQVSNSLKTANVTIQSGDGGTDGEGNIYVNDAVSWDKGHTLTLNATKDIFIYAPITATAGTSKVSLVYGGDYTINMNSGGAINLPAGLNHYSTQHVGDAVVNYTVINSLAQLQAINRNRTGSFALGTDIDNGTTNFTPIGPYSGYRPAGNVGFTGHFDGLGHKIDRLKVTEGTVHNVGLFSTASNAYIANIGLTNAELSVNALSGSYVGILVGAENTNTLIHNAYATGKVTVAGGSEGIGGLVGIMYHSSILNSYTNVAVNDDTVVSPTAPNSSGYSVDTGGLVGVMEYSLVSDSYSAGSVTAATANASRTSTGGLIGGLYYNTSHVSDSYSVATVTGAGASTGGLAGRNYQGLITNSYAAGSVTSPTGKIGGLVGAASGTVRNSFWNIDATTGTGQTIGVGGGSSQAGVTGKNPTQMKTLSTFTGAGWDIDDQGGTGKIWRIYAGHTAPLLRSFMKPLTVNAGADVTKTYDGTKVKTVAASNLNYNPANPDMSQVLGTATGVTLTASGKDVGEYSGSNLTVTGSGLHSVQQGYDIQFAAGDSKLTITKAALTVTAKDDSKIYDGQAYTGGNGVTYGGLVNNESAADATNGTITYDGNSQNAKNAGSYNITAQGLTAQNYNITYKPGTLTVNKKQLTVDTSSLKGNNKVYDGNRNATVSGGSLSGLVTSDAGKVTLSGNGQFNTKDAGHGKRITGVNYTLEGTANSNYSIEPFTKPDLSADITQAQATVIANSDTKTYDGQQHSVTGYSVTGLVNNETKSVLSGITDSGATGTNAGAYTHTVSGAADNGNYHLTFTPGNLTINKKQLTVDTSSLKGNNKVYDGNKNATVTGNLTGIIASDAGKVVLSGNGQFDTKDAGHHKPITGVNYTLEGTANSNYSIEPFTKPSLAGDINQAQATVIANSDTKTYDGQQHSVTGYSVTGLKNGETKAVLTGITQSGGSGKNAGAYTHTVSGSADNGNYLLTFQSGILKINKKQLTVDVSGITAKNKVYDGTKTADVTVGANSLLSGDIVGNDDVSLSAANFNYDDKNAGQDKAITGTFTLAGADKDNYEVRPFTAPTLKADITKANLTINAVTDTKVYDGTTRSSKTATVTGLQTGDTLTTVTQAFTDKNVKGTNGSTLKVTGYNLADGNNGDNYNIIEGTATGTIKKATLHIKAQGGDAADKTYDGTTDAGDAKVDGNHGDTIVAKQHFDNKNAGKDKVVTVDDSSVTIDDGNNGGNYDVVIDTPNTPVTADITKANLTINAVTDTKVYDGTTRSSKTATVTGLKADDTVTTVTQAFTDKNVKGTNGSTLEVTGLTLADGNNGGNYNIIKNTTTGTITKATLHVTPHGGPGNNKTYDGTTDDGDAVVDGNHGDKVVAKQKFKDKNAGKDKEIIVDKDDVTIDDGNNGGNYDVVIDTPSTPATADINKADLTVAVNDATKTYDGTAYSGGNGVTYQGLVPGDTNSEVTGSPEYTGNSQGAINAGTYVIDVNGLSSRNYKLTYASGRLHLVQPNPKGDGSAGILGKQEGKKAFDDSNKQSNMRDGNGNETGNGNLQCLVHGNTQAYRGEPLPITTDNCTCDSDNLTDASKELCKQKALGTMTDARLVQATFPWK